MERRFNNTAISPIAWLVVATCVGVFLILWFVNPYSSGYESERVSLWSKMMVDYSRKDAEWGFGYFVLPAVLALLWISRDRFRDVELRPSAAGLAIILFALFLYFGGYKANQKFYGYAGGQLFVAGVIVWFGGWDLFRRAFWLWVLFGLIWPLTFLINPIAVPMRKIMTVLTYGALSLPFLEGDEVIRAGTNIRSAPTTELAAGERFNLGVAAPCSGLRSLFALSMVSLLYGYLSLERGWQRLVLLASALPLAIVGNFFRMMMLYFGTIWFGSDFAIGSEEHPSAYHIGAGIMVFIVALIGMMALVALLKGGVKSLRRRKTRVRQVSAETAEPSAAESS